MLIGVGAVATRFSDYSLQLKYTIFAGHINDPTTSDRGAFKAEENLVLESLQKDKSSVFIYFSTTDILHSEFSSNPYVQHKLSMEEIVKTSGRNFLIFRLPQLMALSDSPSSLLNSVVKSTLQGRTIEISQNEKCNLVDIDDVHLIVREILNRNIYLNKTISIASSHQTAVTSVVQQVEKFLGRSANVNLLHKGSSYSIDISDIEFLWAELGVKFDGDYILNSLKKYYSHLLGDAKLLSVIVPTYNEEHGIEEFYRRTKAVLLQLAPRFDHEIIFVNDFSTDNTLFKLRELAKIDSRVKVVNFSRNFGNQMGITAGIECCRGDIAVIEGPPFTKPVLTVKIQFC